MSDIVDVSPRPTAKQAYLGDGVYASFDGYQIWLRTEREFGTHFIALEPGVYASLVDYAAGIWGAK